MNKETYEALKRIMKHATEGGLCNTEFWNDVKQVEGWIDEVKNEMDDDNV